MDGEVVSFPEYLFRSSIISGDIRDILSANEIDWTVCRELCDDDWYRMLPGKVGVIRKIRLMLASQFQAEQNLPAVTPSLPSMSLANSLVIPNHTLPNSQQESDSTSSSVASVSTQPNVHSASGSSASGLPLPTYSDRVVSSIRSGSIITEFDRMVEETAYHILKHGDILSRTDYDTFGRRLHDAYPCIDFPGTEPWSFFCRKLSQKLRNIRWRRKTRSVVVKSVSVKSKRLFASPRVAESELSVADASKQLAAELQKQESERDIPRVKKLWDHLFDSRRQDIAHIGDGCVKEILARYPLLNQLKYIQSDFRRLCDPGDVKVSFRSMLSKCCSVLELAEKTGNQEINDLEAVMLMQERLRIKVSPKNKLPPAISVVLPEDLDLKSETKSPPRLIVVQRDDCLDSVYILADTVHVQLIDNVCVCDMLVDLLACYFAWDLSYPKQYQILTFLHLYLLGDTKEQLFKSVALLKFEKLFREVQN